MILRSCLDKFITHRCFRGIRYVPCRRRAGLGIEA